MLLRLLGGSLGRRRLCAVVPLLLLWVPYAPLAFRRSSFFGLFGGRLLLSSGCAHGRCGLWASLRLPGLLGGSGRGQRFYPPGPLDLGRCPCVTRASRFRAAYCEFWWPLPLLAGLLPLGASFSSIITHTASFYARPAIETSLVCFNLRDG